MPETHQQSAATVVLRSLGDVFGQVQHVPSPEDMILIMVQLMHQVAALHAHGCVAELTLSSVRERPDGRLELVNPAGAATRKNLAAIDRVQPKVSSALKVVGEYRVVSDEEKGTSVHDLRAATDEDAAITKPIYLPDLRSWEIELGHHDEITDVFVIGMIMACFVCGLDPTDPAQIERFSMNRSNLFAIAPRLHPVLASIILEATMLNRHERATDLAELAGRLQSYRDQPVALDVDRVLSATHGVPGRRTAVMAHLRDRLFDLSRRNKLIHFRPTQSSVNLTESSMPIVMRIESVRSEQLCTWKGKFIQDVLSGRNVPLGQWLRFEDQPHLPSSFDRLIQETRRDRAEYGFSHLRLAVAFLHWHNLKEAPNERISSPLLWLTAEVTKTKGVRDQYMLRCVDAVAEYNPALRHMLRQLYNIELPAEIDLTQTSLAEVHADLMRQIHHSEPGVRLELQERPQIQLIHSKAVQRVNRFNRRRNPGRQTVSTSVDYSYARDDYRPLGHALFEKFVRPSPLPQRIASGGSLAPKRTFMVAETEALSYAKGGDEGHKFAWEIDLTQVTLANLNYKKMSLVRDYAELIDRPAAQPGFDQVFSIEPRPFTQDVPPPVPYADQWNVLASDATQDAAVALARTGRSFIIQGPPGTGKSQTITNLIADYAARGKRVLFVCEKRAALDVVFHRLGQAGLDRLACIIHDSQEDKKGFIADLKQQYEQWGKSDDRLGHFQTVRAKTVSALDQHIAAIARYDAAVGRPAQGPGLRDLVRRAVTLPPPPAGFGPQLREQLPPFEAWDTSRAMAGRAFRSAHELLGANSLAAHPFALINRATVDDARPVARVTDMIETAEALLQRLDRWLDGGSAVASGTTPVGDAAIATDLANRLVTTGLARALDLLDPLSDASNRLQTHRAEIARLETLRDTAVRDAANWREPLSPGDTAAALDLARAKETSFLRLFSGPWRQLRQTVQERYDFAAHAVTPGITAVLELLAARHAAETAVDAAAAALGERLQSANVNDLIALRAALLDGGNPGKVEIALLESARQSPHPAETLAAEARHADTVRNLRSAVDAVLDGAGQFSFDQLSEVLRDMREALDDLPDLLPALREVHQAEAGVALALRTIPLPLAAIEALIIDEAIARIERTKPEIRRFDIDRLVAAARRASSARDRLRDENSDAITAVLQRKFRENVKVSEQSVTQLDAAGRALKKAYATGRRELEHEFGKSMRYRSIRDLASGDPGNVVNDLKPIWLMSPLSVSDTLPLTADLFDVVIFDEASQIPTEESVPALCRANQVIIVGDEMQLPPTSFFSASLDDEDMEIVAEEDGERIAILLDADSLLNQAARNLPATLLAWHYRSRSEALISFSNAAFYGGQLVTVPDRSLRLSQGQPGPVESGEAAEWAAGVTRLLAAPITVHRMADGLYENRTNLPEARYIAGLVREMLSRETGQSIGIVAFSEAQQSEIEIALDHLAAEDSAFAALLEREYTREDDGQFNGLFVKNLENVQGDERDAILMSVCYAPDRKGRMVMNFGPINQRGGEKRLNVIFSRARRHMGIVTTIAPEAITNTHNDGARALRSFLSFAEAQSGGAQDHAQAVLAGLNPQIAGTFAAALPVDPVRDAIAAGLRARGHTVHEHVGGASFRCDLAVVNTAGDGYALAVLLDRDDGAVGAVEERHVFRPGILRAMGWRVIDVPVANWRHAPDATIARIERELTSCSWTLIDSDPFAGITMPQPDAAYAPKSTGATSAGILSPDDDRAPSAAVFPPQADAPPRQTAEAALTEFRLVEGSSSKFWRIGVSGCDLTVEFGRIGTRGQRVVKTFDDEDRARREQIKLTLEKTRKGYQEIG
ncbi:AAA domain-containing protein [Novosphingobium sp.]|uniref:AAA domain-containing protein n=1 Tax=Novosphingobium sp. TaxID=1874826 RepID=UPI0033401D82